MKNTDLFRVSNFFHGVSDTLTEGKLIMKLSQWGLLYFSYLKVNWKGHNQALFGMIFFLFSLCQNQAHVTLKRSHLKQAIFMQAMRAHNVLKLHENRTSWRQEEPFIRNTWPGVSVCLGVPLEAASAICTLALLLELGKSPVDSVYLIRWKHTSSPLEQWCACNFKRTLSCSWQHILNSSFSHQSLATCCPQFMTSIWQLTYLTTVVGFQRQQCFPWFYSNEKFQK